jgi:hypothetical protein
MNLLEPWILLRLAAGLVASALFLGGARTSWRVLRHFDVAHACEGQLALEKQQELAATFIRVATVLQVGCLAFTVVAADRLSRSVRGAMCAYGVFHSNDWGFRSLGATVLMALVVGVLSQIQAFDSRVRATTDLVRPLAIGALIVAPLAIVDVVTTSLFLLKLDLSAVASCCSVQLDESVAAVSQTIGGPRWVAAVSAIAAILFAIVVGLLAARRPRAPLVALAGAASTAALLPAVAAVVFVVAPHTFELPAHLCPFCLLRSDVLLMGYPLFGALFLAVVWGAGAAVCGLLVRSPGTREAFGSFARSRLRRGVVAWTVALLVGAGPVFRYAMISHGAGLFSR